MRVMLTRPRVDSERLAVDLRARGHDVIIEPMLHIKSTGLLPPLDDVAALILTSANGVRAFAAASDRRDLAVYAVGDATARAAREEGFSIVESAAGDSAALAALIGARVEPNIGALLHIHGREVTGNLDSLLASRGYSVRSSILYEAEAATELSIMTRDHLTKQKIDAALFFSPRTAKTFVRLVHESGLAESSTSMVAICLSEAVAAAGSALQWGAVHVAATPDTAAMMKICDGMQESRRT